ncbi:hypothetical protein TNCV_4009501 [Trichonephila clavipes]|nr:hypothetical protein TNCV_4009501 [Trichonephila clavipes]
MRPLRHGSLSGRSMSPPSGGAVVEHPDFPFSRKCLDFFCNEALAFQFRSSGVPLSGGDVFHLKETVESLEHKQRHQQRDIATRFCITTALPAFASQHLPARFNDAFIRSNPGISNELNSVALNRTRRRRLPAPRHQKSQGLRSGERGGHAVGNARLITLSLVKCCRKNCCTQSPMCGGAPSCMKVTGPLRVVSSKKKGPRMNVAVNPHQTNFRGVKWNLLEGARVFRVPNVTVMGVV